MMGLIGKKIGMTQIYDEHGKVVPVTVLQAGPCVVVQKKAEQTDRYCALQLGFEERKAKRVNKPGTGHFKRAKVDPKRYLREIRLTAEELANFEVGQELKADIFSVGEKVDVIGRSKGRGFTGVVKRHKFSGFGASHGTHEYFRHGGSVGQSAWPSRTFPGLRMPGHHGAGQVTVQNLEVVDIRAGENLLFLKGAVPGPDNGLLLIRKAIKVKKAK
jgi:large subunit ribosomal protein L3